MAVSEIKCLENSKYGLLTTIQTFFGVITSSCCTCIQVSHILRSQCMVCLPAAVFRGFPSDKGETTRSAQGEGLPYGKQTFGLGHVAQRVTSSDQPG